MRVRDNFKPLCRAVVCGILGLCGFQARLKVLQGALVERAEEHRLGVIRVHAGVVR